MRFVSPVVCLNSRTVFNLCLIHLCRANLFTGLTGILKQAVATLRIAVRGDRGEVFAAASALLKGQFTLDNLTQKEIHNITDCFWT